MLSKIDHIVVLMLENRSFDSMAGRLYDPQNPAPFNQVPRNQPFEGLAGKNLSNPISVGETEADNKKVPVGKAGSFTTPEIDPGKLLNMFFPSFMVNHFLLRLLLYHNRRQWTVLLRIIFMYYENKTS
ncbi:alkaline phosphatase family protein [Brevibacillus laterosporus]